MNHISQDGGHAVFRWIWTGTNTGPGGTGQSVRMYGYEEWTIAAMVSSQSRRVTTMRRSTNAS
jgi:hypothetical protein